MEGFFCFAIVQFLRNCWKSVKMATQSHSMPLKLDNNIFSFLSAPRPPFYFSTTEVGEPTAHRPILAHQTPKLVHDAISPKPCPPVHQLTSGGHQLMGRKLHCRVLLRHAHHREVVVKQTPAASRILREMCRWSRPLAPSISQPGHVGGTLTASWHQSIDMSTSESWL